MASLLIITVMAVSLVVSTGYAAYTMIQASDRVSQVQRVSAQLHRLAALVEANLRSTGDDGVASPPAPIVVGATKDRPEGTRLPDWIAPGARTPWSSEIGYCAFAPSADRVSATPTTRSWPADGVPGSHAYVVSAPAAPATVAAAGVIAAVVAPAVGSTKVPACDALRYENGQLTVAAGTVVGIARGSSADMAALAAAATVRRYVAPAPLGDGTGTTPSDAMSLTAALGAWGATHPATTILTLAEGRHVVAAAALDALAKDEAADGRATRLVLRSAAGANVVVAADSTDVVLRAPVDMKLENLTLELGVEAPPGTRLTLAGTVGVTSAKGVPIKVSHARLDVTGTLAVDARGGDGIHVAGGEALFRDAWVDVVVPVGRGGLVSSLGAAVTFAGETRRPILRVRGRGAAIAAIRAGGSRLILDHADVSPEGGTQFGVIMEGGGLEMTASSVGSASARAASAAVLDLGGVNAVADPGSSLWAGSGGGCARGLLFQQTASAARKADLSGDSVGALFAPEGSSTANRAVWTCRY